MTTKAYEVKYKDCEWIDFTHADSIRDARVKFFRQWGGEGDYIDVRAKRVPDLDDLPLTGINIVESAGYPDDWLDGKADTCRCNLCRGIVSK